MKSAIPCDGKVLIVGDGDFSFTVSLMKHSDVVNPGQVFTSNLETETSILHHAQAADNMRSLKDLGVSVFLATDATDLHNHVEISKERFDRIIFNFPLADRHNIKRNRSLLADFFSSCRSVLAPGGRVLVTLCKGQGGTPADQPVRSWHDSWQIVAMATNASFLLRDVVLFDPAEFPEYHSVGFRFQDKSFNVTGALTHVFEEGALIQDGDLNIRGVVWRDGLSYSCSSYVASHLNRNLLEEARNPVRSLRLQMEEMFKKSVPYESLHIQSDCSPIILSHKSKAFSSNEQTDITTLSETSESQSRSEALNDKDRKNFENLKRMTKPQLAHGVVSDTIDGKTDQSVCVENFTTAFLPSENENVYILVKTKDSTGSYDGCSSCEGGIEVKDDTMEGEGEEAESCDWESAVTHPGSKLESSELVHHCRTSLLENLPFLCKVLNEKKFVKIDFCGQNECDSGPMDLDANEKRPSIHSSLSQSESDEQAAFIPSSVTFFPCLMTSGQSLLPCRITPNSSPVKHEFLILHRIGQSDLVSQSVHGEASSTQSQLAHVSSQILSFLHSVTQASSVNVTFSLVSNNSSSLQVSIQGMDESKLISYITVTNLTNEEHKNTETTDQNLAPFCECVGLILQAKMEGCLYHVTIMDLQRLACCLHQINDWRLLVSQGDKFLSQFPCHSDIITMTGGHFCKYQPFSLYPMKFAHDLSFWEKTRDPNDESVYDVSDFDEFALYEVIRSVVGDLVNNVVLIDVYEDPETKRISRCYRLHFLSSDKCLPYVTSWKMQSKIRMEVARSLGVQLR